MASFLSLRGNFPSRSTRAAAVSAPGCFFNARIAASSNGGASRTLRAMPPSSGSFPMVSNSIASLRSVGLALGSRAMSRQWGNAVSSPKRTPRRMSTGVTAGVFSASVSPCWRAFSQPSGRSTGGRLASDSSSWFPMITNSSGFLARESDVIRADRPSVTMVARRMMNSFTSGRTDRFASEKARLGSTSISGSMPNQQSRGMLRS